MIAIDIFSDVVFLVDIVVQLHAAFFVGNAHDGQVKIHSMNSTHTFDLGF